MTILPLDEILFYLCMFSRVFNRMAIKENHSRRGEISSIDHILEDEIL
jgi:hypothetical protein